MIKETVIHKLKATALEFGGAALEGSILVGPNTVEWRTLNGYRYIPCATLAEVKLCNVPFNVARFFEEVR